MLRCCAGLQNVQDLEEMTEEAQSPFVPTTTAATTSLPLEHSYDSSSENVSPPGIIDLTVQKQPHPTFHISS